jgi:hypothetical protein
VVEVAVHLVEAAQHHGPMAPNGKHLLAPEHLRLPPHTRTLPCLNTHVRMDAYVGVCLHMCIYTYTFVGAAQWQAPPRAGASSPAATHNAGRHVPILNMLTYSYV